MLRKIRNDESGQAGGIVTLIIVISIFSFAYIAISVLMDYTAEFNNDLSESFHFTQEHKDAHDLISDYWGSLPFVVMLLIIIFVIKNALRARTGEI